MAAFNFKALSFPLVFGPILLIYSVAFIYRCVYLTILHYNLNSNNFLIIFRRDKFLPNFEEEVKELYKKDEENRKNYNETIGAAIEYRARHNK